MDLKNILEHIKERGDLFKKKKMLQTKYLYIIYYIYKNDFLAQYDPQFQARYKIFQEITDINQKKVECSK